MELRGHSILTRRVIGRIFNYNTDEAFVDIQVGPVICTAGKYP